MTENTSSPSQKGRIFISYRRIDSAGYAGRIYDRLVAYFGEDAIFMDVDTIEGGTDFTKVLEDAVQSCDVLIALIGGQWLSIKDKDGERRLDNPEDFVRVEIATALKRNIRVIPVLVDGVDMPQPTDLPENLKTLARRNALRVNHHSFNPDIYRLLEHSKSALDEAKALRAKAVRPKTEQKALFRWILTLLPLAFIILAFVAYSQAISDAIPVLGGLIVICPSVIVISILQWLVLRKAFLGALRWVGINAIYIILVSCITIVLLATTFSSNNTFELMSVSFFVVLALWLFPNYYFGWLTSKKLDTSSNFFSQHNPWNISFWTKWIATPLLGLLATAIVLIPLNAFASVVPVPSWVPTWFGGSLIFGIWGCLLGFFQWLILRNRLRNFNWLITAYVVTGAIPWGDPGNLTVGLIFVSWILGSLILAPLLVWRIENGNSKINTPV